MNIKRILFLHPNFPAQFKTLAAALGGENNIDAKFICMTNFGNKIRGVKELIIKGKHGQSAMDELKLNEIKSMQFRAESYRLAFMSLKNNGWSPDIVIGHTGWGCGVHVKDVWPKCMFIGYVEWWFDINSSLSEGDLYDPYMKISKELTIKSLRRNLYTALELCTSDTIVSPSEWQRNQLPSRLKEYCTVIHDGIDVSYFSKATVKPCEKPLITYGTRGMEPMRCFRQFIKSIPYIIKAIPNACIEIAGEDKICYGGLPPNNKTSWGIWAKQYLENSGVSTHVTWKGRLKYSEYKEWLQKSWCHIYLSQPFVVSWSLLESMATGVPIVANNILPIQEFASDVNGVYLIDKPEAREIVNGVLQAIKANAKNPYANRHTREKTCRDVSVVRSLKYWKHVTGLELHTSV